MRSARRRGHDALEQALLLGALRAGDYGIGGTGRGRSLGPGLVDQARRMRQGGLRCCARRGAKVAPEPILATLKEAPDGFRSSMQKDVAAGRLPELEAIAGPILRGGTEHGIDVSATRALLDRIMELE